MTHIKQLQGNLLAIAWLPEHAAATATEAWPVFWAPGAVAIVKVVIIPKADVTGQDTDTTHLNLFNVGIDGDGTTELANYDLVAGNDLDSLDGYVLYEPATALELVDTTVLALQHQKVANGLLVPAMQVVTEYRAQD